MNFTRLLNTPLGQFFISILLGLGLACLFRRACTEKNCIIFNGPIISEFDDKIYQYDNKCYKYEASPSKCDDKGTKRVLDMATPDPEAAPAKSQLSILGNNA